MQEILDFLKGKKTYFLAAAGACTAIATFLGGESTLYQLIAALFGAGGLASLRAGIKNG